MSKITKLECQPGQQPRAESVPELVPKLPLSRSVVTPGPQVGAEPIAEALPRCAVTSRCLCSEEMTLVTVWNCRGKVLGAVNNAVLLYLGQTMKTAEVMNLALENTLKCE